MNEELSSSETFVLVRATRRNIQEGATLQVITRSTAILMQVTDIHAQKKLMKLEGLLLCKI
jgi:hypothetical protein